MCLVAQAEGGQEPKVPPELTKMQRWNGTGADCNTAKPCSSAAYGAAPDSGQRSRSPEVLARDLAGKPPSLPISKPQIDHPRPALPSTKKPSQGSKVLVRQREEPPPPSSWGQIIFKIFLYLLSKSIGGISITRNQRSRIKQGRGAAPTTSALQTAEMKTFTVRAINRQRRSGKGERTETSLNHNVPIPGDKITALWSQGSSTRGRAVPSRPGFPAWPMLCAHLLFAALGCGERPRLRWCTGMLGSGPTCNADTCSFSHRASTTLQKRGPGKRAASREPRVGVCALSSHKWGSLKPQLGARAALLPVGGMKLQVQTCRGSNTTSRTAPTRML